MSGRGLTYSYRARVRRTADGVERVYQDGGGFPYGEGDHSFIWEEGNYACDCNRELFFRRAGGEEREWDESQCTSGRYLCRVELIRSDGVVEPVIDELGEER